MIYEGTRLEAVWTVFKLQSTYLKWILRGPDIKSCDDDSRGFPFPPCAVMCASIHFWIACPRATITEHLSLLPLLPAVLTFHPLLSIFIFRAPYKLPNTHPETHPPRPSNHSKSESICFCSPHLSPPCPGCFFIWHLLDCWCMDLWMLLAAMKLYSEFGSRTGSLPKQ